MYPSRILRYVREYENMQVLPNAPAELIAELSRRYIMLYERITQQPFQPALPEKDPRERMQENLAKAGL